MTRFFPGATSFKSSSSVKFENVLPARSATSFQELIATFTDSCWDVIESTSLVRVVCELQIAFSAISSFSLVSLADELFNNGGYGKSADFILEYCYNPSQWVRSVILHWVA